MTSTLPVTSALVGWYKGEDWNGTSWPDSSGSGNNVTEKIGTPQSQGRYVYGVIGDGLRFPSTILPATYTLFHVAKYNGETKKRIFDGVNKNWLSGFWNGRTGVAYHEGWLTQTSTPAYPTGEVLVSTDQKGLYRGNGVNLKTTTVAGTSDRLSINYGYHTQVSRDERSQWAVSEVIVYNRELSLSEIQQVESYLETRKNEIDLQSIQSNLGGSNPIALSDYYGKTGYAPSSGTISLNSFRRLTQVPLIGIPPKNLQVYLDASDSRSYPGTGTTWYDISGNGINFNISASAHNTTYMDFEGSHGIAKRVVNNNLSDIGPYPNATIVCVAEILPSTSGSWRTLVRGASADHQVIVQNGGTLMGMYDNGGAGFQSSGFSTDTLPTGYNLLVWKLSQSSPYYQFTYNTVGTFSSITTASSTFDNGFSCIGGYHNYQVSVTDSSQYFGKIKSFMLYNSHLSTNEISILYNTLFI